MFPEERSGFRCRSGGSRMSGVDGHAGCSTGGLTGDMTLGNTAGGVCVPVAGHQARGEPAQAEGRAQRLPAHGVPPRGSAARGVLLPLRPVFTMSFVLHPAPRSLLVHRRVCRGAGTRVGLRVRQVAKALTLTHTQREENTHIGVVLGAEAHLSSPCGR